VAIRLKCPEIYLENMTSNVKPWSPHKVGRQMIIRIEDFYGTAEAFFERPLDSALP
jgi:hypothetical protein